MEINKIYNENCLDTMARMPDGFVDLSVTSPPYDNLRDYKGFSFHLEKIGKELFRVTKDGGVVVWIVGDATIKGSETGTSFKQALYFKEIGFNLHDTMIYSKNNPIPLNHNRYEQKFEYMFVFSKGKPKTFNPLLENCKASGNIQSKRTFWQDSKSEVRQLAHSNKEVKNTKFKYNIWEYSVGSTKGLKHPAPFPEKLANDHIISWSNENDLVYDPFMGSGTTAKMALLNNRKFVGSEIAKEYCEIAEKRINENL
jgi:DNA modification methylase